MNQPTNNQLFIFLRHLSNTTILGNIIPRRIKIFLFACFSKRTKLLRKQLIRYYKNSKSYPNDKVKAYIDFLRKHIDGLYLLDLLNIWLNYDKTEEKYYDFNGAKLPYISHCEQMETLTGIFLDTFLFSCIFEDKYNKPLVEQFDPFMLEGPYGYTDTDFDVTIKKNDVVIDAGAYIGDFSAYAASKDATVYAFEPVSINYEILVKTVLLNENKIIPVKKALGNENGEIDIIIPNLSGASTLFLLSDKDEFVDSEGFAIKEKFEKEIIKVITLDEFVEKESIKKMDFIKADIEGAERYMLMGAKKTLKEFAPKLAICTYHTPEDPELLEKLILDANPKYSVIHTSHKLFAMVKK